MRRLVLAAAVLALHAAPVAQSGQERPLQADGVVRLLADLENAIASGRPEDLRAIASPAMPPGAERPFARVTRAGRPSAAIVREISRRPIPGSAAYEVLADVLVRHGRQGRLATWQIATTLQDGARDRYQIAALSEIAAVDGLLRLELDATRQFTVHELTLRAPDFTLTMESGTAFVAESDAGVTALVLRGRGRVEFTPADAAEQGQVRLFSGKPAFSSTIDAAFLRLSPFEFRERIAEASLKPAGLVSALEARRAREIFDEFSPKSYNLDLASLTPDLWSLEPGHGSTISEIRTAGYGWLTYARSPGEAEDISFFDRAHNRNMNVYASPERLLQRGPTYSEDDEAAYDVLRYGVDVAFEPSRAWVEGRGSLQVRIKRFAVTSITIKLAPRLTVQSVTSPAFGRLLALRVVGQSNVLLSFPRPLDRGEEFTIDVVYSGQLDPQKLDREALDVAADQQPQEPPSTIQVVVPPEPRLLYSNRVAWYPQAPIGDYAPATMRLTLPSEFQVVASGTLISSAVTQVESASRGQPRVVRTVEFAADRPVRYLACVISRFVPVGRTRVEVAPGKPINLEVVSTPRMAGRNRHTVAVVTNMLRFYAGLIGDAPYPDFTLAVLDDNLPGGHSPPFFAVLHQELPSTPYSWASDPVAFGERYQHFFLAHEVAHQWWGQAVGWKNYHEQWLSEGLTQYFALLYAEKDRGPALVRTLLADMRASAAPLVAQGPIALGYRLGHLRADGRIFRAIVYNKSAVVLHMLRQLIGDEAFFAGLRKFHKDWQFQKAGTEDLRAAFEAHTPMPLGRFFERWIGGAEPARARVTSRVAPDGATATVRVEQVGDVFDFPLTVVVQYADGSSAEVLIKVTEPVVEERIPLKSPLRRITPRTDTVLVDIVR